MLSDTTIATYTEKYFELLNSLDLDDVTNIYNLLETKSVSGTSFKERLIFAPLNNRDSNPCAYAGGLLEHILLSTGRLSQLNNMLKLNLDKKSIIKVGLLHAIGYVGDEINDLFIPETNDWKREKLGQHYTYNPELRKMSVTHRTLSMLQKYNIALTHDEWLAIQLSSGFHFEENRFYVNDTPKLALYLQQAKQQVLMQF